MFCKKCNEKMNHVMRFEKDKSTEFDRCPKCFYETKHKTIKFDTVKTKTDKLQTSKNSLLLKGKKSSSKKKGNKLKR